MAVVGWRDATVRLESDIRGSVREKRRQRKQNSSRFDRQVLVWNRPVGMGILYLLSVRKSHLPRPCQLSKISMKNPVQGHAVKSELWARKL